MLATRRWRAIGTDIEVVADQAQVDAAATIVRDLVHDLDRACSRFDPDSELRRLPTGYEVPVGPVLNAALAAALRTAERTHGFVDPTVGRSLRRLGYDDDLAVVRGRSAPAPAVHPEPAPGWWRVLHDERTSRVLVPHGIELDLGASAKAWAADEAARRCARQLDGPVLVNLGGDLAVAGPPPRDGWRIAVVDGLADADPVVTIRAGGVATSSTVLRTWPVAAAHALDGLNTRHHIVDPATGASAAPVWAAVSVAARSCEFANAAATAAVVLGRAAGPWLEARGVHARLVTPNGRVVRTGDWPADLEQAA